MSDSLNKETQEVLDSVAKDILDRKIDDPEDLKWVEQNTSTNLSPIMRITLAQIILTKQQVKNANKKHKEQLLGS